MVRLIALTFLGVWSTLGLARTEDHPLLSRPEGASVIAHQQIAYERFELPVGLPDNQLTLNFDMKSVVGDLSRHSYQVRGTSSLGLFESYQRQLEQAGFEILFQCGLDDCGDLRQVRALGSALAIGENLLGSWRRPYYLAAAHEGEQGPVYVGLFVGGQDGEVIVHQAIVEPVAEVRNLVSVDTEYLRAPRDVETKDPVITESERARDHPLVSRYPGSRIRERRHRDYETFAVPISAESGQNTGLSFDRLDLVGEVTQHFYELDGVSTLQVYENYRAALEAADFEILFACALDACGNSAQTRVLGSEVSPSNNVYNYYRKPYYLVGKRRTLSGPAYVGIFVGGYKDTTAVQQVVVETRETELDLVAVNPDLLHQELEEAGRASIYGILFDTNRAEVKKGSEPALDSVAKLLNEHQDIELYVVGHTDDTGPVEHNLRLSTQRAEAVVARLVKDYQIDAKRLHAAGAGPYAPTANNATKEGREQNRRVELVNRIKQ